MAIGNANDDGEEDGRKSYWWRSTMEWEEEGQLIGDLSKICVADPKVRVIRELERLAGLAPDIDDLRQKLVVYRSGDFWMPRGGLHKNDCDIPPVNTLLLVGFSDAGKSALINLMYCVLGRAGLMPFAQTAGPTSEFGSLFLEEHNVLRSPRNGFCVFDSRGLSMRHMEDSQEALRDWMSEGVRHHLLAWRDSDGESPKQNFTFPAAEIPSKFARRKVGCVVLVVDISAVHSSLKDGRVELLQSIKEIFCAPSVRQYNDKPILIMTHGDLLTPCDRIEARVKLSQFLGTSETNGIYDIACLTEYGVFPEEADPITAYALVEVVYRALMHIDKNHPPKATLQDKLIYFFMSSLICIITHFGVFANWIANLGKRRLNMYKRK